MSWQSYQDRPRRIRGQLLELLATAIRLSELLVTAICLSELLAPRHPGGRTALSWAARNGHEAVVRLLLEKVVSVDSKDGYGRTALSWAAEKGHKAVVTLLKSKT